MDDQAQLLPGTLDLLILRAVSLGPLHGYGILLRIGQISGNSLLTNRVLSTQDYFDSSARAYSGRVGAHRRTTAGQSFTRSLLGAAGACRKKPTTGTGSSPPSPPPSPHNRRKHDPP